MSAAAPFRLRTSPRSPLADRVLDWRTQARISAGELASATIQALRGSALRVYLVLRSAAYKLRGDVVKMGIRRIAALAGVDPRTAHRAVRDLQGAGLLLIERCFDIAADWSHPGDMPNAYTVYRPPEALAAQERRRRREAGEPLPPEPAVELLLDDVEHDPGSSESLRDQAERLARAAALAYRPALEAELATLASSAELLEQLPTFARPSGWQRWRHFSAAQDCLRAIDGRRHAERALEAARAVLAEGLGVLDAEQPGPRGWVAQLHELRLGLGQAAAVAGLAQAATSAAERAARTWAPLLVARPPARGHQAELDLEPAPAELALGPGEPWRAPMAWRPSGPRSPKTWASQREGWTLAATLAPADGERLRAKLRSQGFDPDWPDPEL